MCREPKEPRQASVPLVEEMEAPSAEVPSEQAEAEPRCNALVVVVDSFEAAYAYRGLHASEGGGLVRVCHSPRKGVVAEAVVVEGLVDADEDGELDAVAAWSRIDVHAVVAVAAGQTSWTNAGSKAEEARQVQPVQ